MANHLLPRGRANRIRRANPRLSELQLLAPSSASMLLLPQLLLSSASADLSAAQPTLSLPLVRRRRHHPRVTHAARRLSQAAPLPTTEAGPFFGSVSDDYVAPVTLGVGRGAQTFLLVADTGSNPNPSPNPNLLPQPEPWPSWPWP